MPKAVYLIVGIGVLLAVTFANPLSGNVLGFCPVSEGPKAILIDGIVTLVDAACVWMIVRAIRV